MTGNEAMKRLRSGEKYAGELTRGHAPRPRCVLSSGYRKGEGPGDTRAHSMKKNPHTGRAVCV